VFVEILPDGGHAGHADPLPVIVVVDGDYMFEPLVDAAKKLQRENKIPRVLLVGIGYGKPFGNPLNKRGRDYTPSAGEDEPESGGAQSFFQHLTGALWEDLARRHPFRTGLRVIAGHSLGGLFALHAFFQSRPFFDSAIVGAPSLWWNNHRYFAQFAQFRATHPSFAAAPARQDAAHTRLFLGIGAKDTDSMTADLSRFERQLAESPWPGPEIISRIFPGHDHYNVLPRLFHDGLHAVLR
jgi:predicted alpha/beta superfamily hydrolase